MMALKGKAKTDYQREYMRYKRAGQTTSSGSNKPDFKAKLAKVGLVIAGTDNSLAPQSTRSPLKEETRGKLPLFNPRIHKEGDRVRMPSGEIVVVPELDGEGSIIPEF